MYSSARLESPPVSFSLSIRKRRKHERGLRAHFEKTAMLRFFIVAWFIATARAGCPLWPKPHQTSAKRLPGDGGYRILISGDYDKYIPNAVYTISLQGPSIYEDPKKFSRFTLSVDSLNVPYNPAARVGFFQVFPDSLTQFNEDCVNTISEVSDRPKSQIQTMWRAPPTGSGCVVFTAMVMESTSRWFAEEGKLMRTFCEMSPRETELLDDLRCCSCDAAKYKMVMEGLWTRNTHPKDFPESVWLTHFSDLVGASHETNFSFWGRNHIATDGFRQLAEWGSASGLEAELRTNAKFLRTYIKAPGLWYPNVNSNTSATFNVDRKHPLVSVASMLGPSPDWVVGVSKLNLCQKDCNWIKGMTIDLYPWDAGTDNGISYMSPNSETRPREYMKPITTMYPEDPRSPFYDPSGKPMLPLARLYIDRKEIIKGNCDDNDLEQQVAEFNVVETTSDIEKPECMTTEYSDWSKCSVTCGKGLRMRTRAYRIPEKAAMMGCNRQLVSKEMCLAPAGECSGVQKFTENPFPGLNNSLCMTTNWSDWSECGSSCGDGVKTRRRRLLNAKNRKKCIHVPLFETNSCRVVRSDCSRSSNKTPTSNFKNCKMSSWSKWTPCNKQCGVGRQFRSRLLMEWPDTKECNLRNKLQLHADRQCFGTNCGDSGKKLSISMQSSMNIPEFCLQPPNEGKKCPNQEISPVTRWGYDKDKQTCDSFSFLGCGGNKNNFLDYMECEAACKVAIQSSVDSNERSDQLDRDSTIKPDVEDSDPRLQRDSKPVDCEVTAWQPWSKCSVTCGFGITTSFRQIKIHPRDGGKQCPTQLKKYAKCKLQPCDQ